MSSKSFHPKKTGSLDLHWSFKCHHATPRAQQPTKSNLTHSHLACIVEVAHLIAIIGNQMEQVEGLIAGIHPNIGLTFPASTWSSECPNVSNVTLAKFWSLTKNRPIWPPKPSQAHCSWCSNGPTNSGSKTWEKSAISNHSIRWYLVPHKV